MGGIHQQISTITSFRAFRFHYGVVDVGDHGVSARDFAIKPGDDATGFHDVVVNVRNRSMCAFLRRRQ